ncbi:MAG TPA: hypothetical protein VN578_08175 [Candidatus Binatia bacterium]|nr:hypothetical protein [Candidatus Binatia bacterium]
MQTALQPNPQTKFPGRTLAFWAEPGATLAATGLVAGVLALKALNAGPLWRDETNSINVAQMPSLSEFWDSMRCESFPALWLLLLRGWSALGLAESDSGIRVLGLVVGLLFLGCLWLYSRWIHGRAPILSVALLGSLPAFVNIAGANRAYGLAMCLLVLNFGMLWRYLESPTRSRAVLAALASLLFVHTVYYDEIFLCAMLAGACGVVLRRRQWRTLGTLVGIGLAAGSSTMIYWPNLRRAAHYVPMIQVPFTLPDLWKKLSQAVAAQSSAHSPGPSASGIWIWMILLLAGTAAAVLVQFGPGRSATERTTSLGGDTGDAARADLALFSGVSMLGGVTGYFFFLLKLHYPTEPWYYLGLLTLLAISLDGVLGAAWPVWRPCGMLRTGFLVLMIGSTSGAVWEEAHTRQSNVDLVAAALQKNAQEGDLIVVQGAWEGITFDRYYRGRTRWVTLPPINSHKVHRNDLVWEKLNQPEPIAPVLTELSDTLRGGKRVWVVGQVGDANRNRTPSPLPPPPNLPTKWYLGPYSQYWCAQVISQLVVSAGPAQFVPVPVERPVNFQENLPLLRFPGYQPADRP